jgi:hypothetical protein
MNLDQNTEYLRASLKEMVTRLAYPGSLSAIEIVQNGRVAETLLLVLDRLDKLEQRP